MILVHSDRGHPVDGIRDHTRQLAEALGRLPRPSAELRLKTRGAPGGRIGGSLQLPRRLLRHRSSSAFLIQYSPFCYGRWGFAPWLPAYLLAARLGGRRPTVALMVHEPYVPMSSWRWALMGLWQRFQLACLRLAADVVFTSIEPWRRKLASSPPRRPVHHLPVGSNFPDERRRREEERAALGCSAETLLVCCLGREHPGFLGEYVTAAVNAIAAEGRPVALLNMGAQAPPPRGLDPRVAVHSPGFLEPDRFAARLAASDLFLAPLADGVSTRRGSLMAALQHGLPVVGTAGHLTDPLLADAAPALRLTPVGDREAFGRSAARLTADPTGRASAGAAARLLYEREFDWQVLARRMLAALETR